MAAPAFGKTGIPPFPDCGTLFTKTGAGGCGKSWGSKSPLVRIRKKLHSKIRVCKRAMNGGGRVSKCLPGCCFKVPAMDAADNCQRQGRRVWGIDLAKWGGVVSALDTERHVRPSYWEKTPPEYWLSLNSSINTLTACLCSPAITLHTEQTMWTHCEINVTQTICVLFHC